MSRLGLAAAILVAGLAAAGLWVWLAPGGRPGDAALLRLLAAHRASLAEVGNALLAAPPEAKIDLRPAGIIDLPDPRHAAALRAAGIALAWHDGNAGGVLFQAYGAGISISGLSTGLRYAPGLPLPTGARQVQDLTAGFDAARAEQGARASDLLLIRPVDTTWALFLQTY